MILVFAREPLRYHIAAMGVSAPVHALAHILVTRSEKKANMHVCRVGR